MKNFYQIKTSMNYKCAIWSSIRAMLFTLFALGSWFHRLALCFSSAIWLACLGGGLHLTCFRFDGRFGFTLRMGDSWLPTFSSGLDCRLWFGRFAAATFWSYSNKFGQRWKPWFAHSWRQFVHSSFNLHHIKVFSFRRLFALHLAKIRQSSLHDRTGLSVVGIFLSDILNLNLFQRGAHHRRKWYSSGVWLAAFTSILGLACHLWVGTFGLYSWRCLLAGALWPFACWRFADFTFTLFAHVSNENEHSHKWPKYIEMK